MRYECKTHTQFSFSVRTHTRTHTGTGSLGFAKVHQIKQMRLERGMFNFEESKTQFQMHRGVINSNVSPLRRID